MELDQEPIKELVDLGSEMTAAAAAGVVGLAVGGPAGAIIGAAGAPPLVRVVREFADRLVGRSQRRRVGLVVLLIADRIAARHAAGDEPRADGFFEASGERSAAEEIAEGVLLAAQTEHEERKLPFLANLYANVAFDTRVDRALANLLVRLAERLSYRQLCLLALFVNGQVFGLPNRNYRQAGITTDNPFVGVILDALELHQLGFLMDGSVWLGVLDVNPSAKVQGIGSWLYELAGLREVEISEMANLALAFQLAAIPDALAGSPPANVRGGRGGT